MMYIKVLLKGRELYPWLQRLILFETNSSSVFTNEPKVAYVPIWLKKYLDRETNYKDSIWERERKNLWDRHFLTLGLTRREEKNPKIPKEDIFKKQGRILESLKNQEGRSVFG